MEPEKPTLAKVQVPTILFFVTGVFWAGVIATGGGVLLGWALLSCFACGLFQLRWSTSWVTRPLVAASSLFGVALTAYQLYLGLDVLVSGPQSIAFVSVPLFLVFTVVYLYLFYDGVWRSEE